MRGGITLKGGGVGADGGTRSSAGSRGSYATCTRNPGLKTFVLKWECEEDPRPEGGKDRSAWGGKRVMERQHPGNSNLFHRKKGTWGNHPFVGGIWPLFRDLCGEQGGGKKGGWGGEQRRRSYTGTSARPSAD